MREGSCKCTLSGEQPLCQAVAMLLFAQNFVRGFICSLRYVTSYSLYCRTVGIPMYASIHTKVSLFTPADEFNELNLLLCVEACWVTAYLAGAG